MSTPEQHARDLLERLGVERSQEFTAGDLGELANIIAERDSLASRLDMLIAERVKLEGLLNKWMDRAEGERSKLEAAESRLAACIDEHDKLVDVFAFLRGLLAEGEIDALHEAIGDEGQLHAMMAAQSDLPDRAVEKQKPICGAACDPRIARFATHGVCQLERGHQGPHSAYTPTVRVKVLPNG